MTEAERLASQLASQGPDAGVARPQLDIAQVSAAHGRSRPARSSGRGCSWSASAPGSKARTGSRSPACRAGSAAWASTGPDRVRARTRPSASRSSPTTSSRRCTHAPKQLLQGAQGPAGRRRAARRVARRRRRGVRRRRSRRHAGGVHADRDARVPAAGCARRAPRRSSVRSRRDRPRSRSDPTRSPVGCCSTTAPRSAPSCWTASAARRTRCGHVASWCALTRSARRSCCSRRGCVLARWATTSTTTSR